MGDSKGGCLPSPGTEARTTVPKAVWMSSLLDPENPKPNFPPSTEAIPYFHFKHNQLRKKKKTGIPPSAWQYLKQQHSSLHKDYKTSQSYCLESRGNRIMEFCNTNKRIREVPLLVL